ncbi:MAG TPA: LysM peptidoglycan-binding domain-containing protein [Gemmatimonadaceae bacterium]|nr:LysM peptidoglycan-binding domain-containing protein [Gemmatimonadaceae bacterium]
MKETEGLYRAGRFIRRVLVGTITLIAVVAAVGYLFLMRQVDPASAWAYATRELDGGALHYDEHPVRIARVYRRRPANYFRAANGLLVATPERVLFIGIEPRDILAGADAPAAILTSEFPNDTLLSASLQRVYSLTAHGVVISRGNRAEQYAASSGYEDQLDSLVGYLTKRKIQERAAAAQDRELREQLANLLRQPLHYVVERGDALSVIASRYNATPAQLREWNHLASDRIRAGETLLVRPGK